MKLTKPQLATLVWVEMHGEVTRWGRKGSIPLQNLWRKGLLERSELTGSYYPRGTFSWKLTRAGKAICEERRAEGVGLVEEFGWR